jgi:hypothetical protein
MPHLKPKALVTLETAANCIVNADAELIINYIVHFEATIIMCCKGTYGIILINGRFAASCNCFSFHPSKLFYI